MIKISPEIICISSPPRGRFPRVSVVPKRPIKAGKSPIKHPGHAPPKSVPKIAKTGITPFFFETIFKSLNFSMTRIIVKETRRGIIKKLINAKLIANNGL
jgi:hypothetical protein